MMVKKTSDSDVRSMSVTHSSPTLQVEDDEILDYPGAAALLGIRPGTLKKWLSDQSVAVPHYKINGKIVRFSRAELLAFRKGWKKNGV